MNPANIFVEKMSAHWWQLSEMIPLELKFQFIFQFFGVIFPDDILSFVFCSGSGKGNFVSGIPQRKFPYGNKGRDCAKKGSNAFRFTHSFVRCTQTLCFQWIFLVGLQVTFNLKKSSGSSKRMQILRKKCRWLFPARNVGDCDYLRLDLKGGNSGSV